MKETVSALELAAIREAAFKAEALKHQATAAAAAVETMQLRVFIRYGLTEADSIDLNTGTITRAAPATPQE